MNTKEALHDLTLQSSSLVTHSWLTRRDIMPETVSPQQHQRQVKPGWAMREKAPNRSITATVPWGTQAVQNMPVYKGRKTYR
jgi:hypothetical protein